MNIGLLLYSNYYNNDTLKNTDKWDRIPISTNCSYLTEYMYDKFNITTDCNQTIDIFDGSYTQIYNNDSLMSGGIKYCEGLETCKAFLWTINYQESTNETIKSMFFFQDKCSKGNLRINNNHNIKMVYGEIEYDFEDEYKNVIEDLDSIFLIENYNTKCEIVQC